MLKIVLGVIGALGIGLAATTLPAASGVAGSIPSVGANRIDAAAAYSLADVLQPGSRGSVVEV